MPSVTRLGDLTTGHSGWIPRPSIEGDSRVLSSGIPVVRVGDAYAVHPKPGSPPHGGTAAAGSPKCFASGKAKMRIGDSISCGDFVAVGDPKVILD